MRTAMPEIATLCGSSRLRDAFEQERRRLSLEGRIVISLDSFERAEDVDTSPQV